jgi:hypothetical protein
VIFGGRKNCKSLLQKELRNYGIFEDSRIVPSHLCRKWQEPQISRIFTDFFATESAERHRGYGETRRVDIMDNVDWVDVTIADCKMGKI